jgi:hypothetical protein
MSQSGLKVNPSPHVARNRSHRQGNAKSDPMILAAVASL